MSVEVMFSVGCRVVQEEGCGARMLGDRVNLHLERSRAVAADGG